MMVLSFEDIHGNKKEEELTLGDGDKLIVRFTKDVNPEEIVRVMKIMSKFLNMGAGAVVPIPYYVEFVVVKVKSQAEISEERLHEEIKRHEVDENGFYKIQRDDKS